MHHPIFKRAAFAVPVFCLATAALFACHDTATETDGVRSADDAGVTASRSPSSAGERERTRLRDRNKLDWVGQAHNDAITAFRDDLRRSGKPAKFCEHVLGFVLRENRLPPQHRDGTRSAKKAVAEVLATAPLCAADSGRGGNIRTASLVRAVSATPQSTLASELLSRIGEAVAVAYDRYDLATRLNAIMDAAEALAGGEWDMIAVTVSVAQHSFDYWQAQIPPFMQEIETAYGPCADQYLALGYTEPTIRSICMNGSSLVSGEGGIRAPLFVSLSLTQQTSAERLATRMKNVVFADAKGAFTAGFGTLMNTGSPNTAVGAAILGASGASIATAGGYAWDVLMEMRKKRLEEVA